MVQEQKMSDLPEDRLEPSPPFTYCAVDLFGPFIVKEGRQELKRYGVLFTCMTCRAVHLESVNSLETDSFLNYLRRFILCTVLFDSFGRIEVLTLLVRKMYFVNFIVL